MTSNGFDFEKVEVESEDDKPAKKGKTAQYKDKILNAVKQNGQINLKTATDLLGCSLKAQSVLRELTMLEVIKKDGRGQKAQYTFIQTT
jgi:hypothetical protein